jgi:hypothetical protein
MTFPHCAAFVRNHRSRRSFRAGFCVTFAAALLAVALALPARGQSYAEATGSVVILLPPKVVSGQPATLAILSADGRLASNVAVAVGGQSVKTDMTGRASFTVPSDARVIVARSSGVSAAALVDQAVPSVSSHGSSQGSGPVSGQGIMAPTVISQRDQFWICGGTFRGDADANPVQIGDVPAPVLAASPECLVALAGPKTKVGTATILVGTAEARWSTTTTVVSLEFEPPNPPLTVQGKSNLTVHVAGSASPLSIVVKNETPGVLRFLQGDTQELRTSGGSPNAAKVEAQAIRSGDFSFRAQLARAPDLGSAQRYLNAARSLAPSNTRRWVERLAETLAKNPRGAEKVRRELDKMIAATAAGDFRTVLEAARAAL